jgi:hypothetical protein
LAPSPTRTCFRSLGAWLKGIGGHLLRGSAGSGGWKQEVSSGGLSSRKEGLPTYITWRRNGLGRSGLQMHGRRSPWAIHSHVAESKPSGIRIGWVHTSLNTCSRASKRRSRRVSGMSGECGEYLAQNSLRENQGSPLWARPQEAASLATSKARFEMQLALWMRDWWKTSEDIQFTEQKRRLNAYGYSFRTA